MAAPVCVEAPPLAVVGDLVAPKGAHSNLGVSGPVGRLSASTGPVSAKAMSSFRR